MRDFEELQQNMIDAVERLAEANNAHEKAGKEHAIADMPIASCARMSLSKSVWRKTTPGKS